MQTITSADVSNWLQEQAEKVHQHHEHAQIRAFICQNRDYPAKPVFSIYCGKHVASAEYHSIEECLAEIGAMTSDKLAAKLRERAAILRDEADSIEAQAAALESSTN